MKKIKYLILILPLLLISNVKAECTNYVDLNTIKSNGQKNYNVLSSTSFESPRSAYNRNGTTITFPSLELNKTYILSFDITQIDTSIWDTGYSDFLKLVHNDFLSYESLNGEINSSTRNFKIKFTTPNRSDTQFQIQLKPYTSSTEPTNIIIENFYLYEESIYDSCINPISQPTTYTYTFKVDNEIYSTGTVNEGTVVSLPENPTKEGYTFTGWTLNGESYTGGEIHSNIEIIANFEEIQVEPTPEPETPSESTQIDISGLVPYLLLISALLMLIILRDFIKNLFKSRR